MAGDWLKIALVVLSINMFLYIGAAQSGATVIDFEGDMLSQYLVKNFNSTNMLEDATKDPVQLNESIISAPQRSTAPVVGTFLEVLNSLDVAFDAIKTIFNIAFAPLVLFQIHGLPTVIAFIIAIPLVILFWLSIIQLVRGAS